MLFGRVGAGFAAGAWPAQELLSLGLVGRIPGGLPLCDPGLTTGDRGNAGSGLQAGSCQELGKQFVL